MISFKNSFLTFSLLLLGLTSFAQIAVKQEKLIFNKTNELSTDSMALVVYNVGIDTIELDTAIFFKTHSTFPFYCKDVMQAIAPGDSSTVWVYFKPYHNIEHKSHLVLVTSPSAYSLTIELQAQGTYSLSYYAATENKTEEALKTSLKSIISTGTISLGYNTARDKMFMEIDNQFVNGQNASQNTLECAYTGRKTVGYTSRTDAQNTSDPNKSFNTEHTFPQGFFSQNEPMRSDLHHLFPTDDGANNSRNNFQFGIASLPYVNDATNFPSHLGSNSLYEPRDVQKGKTARAMMYFVLRYQDYTNHFAPQESILRTWHNAFPPTTIDKKRNNDIAVLQKNRNPFIDYPQFIERINKIIGTSSEPLKYEVYYTHNINTFPIIDTTDSLKVLMPVVNNGNTTIKIYNIRSLSNHLSFENDTIFIAPKASSNIPVTIFTNNASATNSDLIQFDSNYSLVPGDILLNYEIQTFIGINKSEKKLIHLYPNPTEAEVNLTYHQNATYRIYDVNYKLCMSGEISKGTNSLNVELLPPGIYQLMIENSIARIIKQ